jgi:hypothetical protein
MLVEMQAAEVDRSGDRDSQNYDRKRVPHDSPSDFGPLPLARYPAHAACAAADFVGPCAALGDWG